MHKIPQKIAKCSNALKVYTVRVYGFELWNSVTVESFKYIELQA